MQRLGLDVLMFPLLRTDAEDEAALTALTEHLTTAPPDLLLANTGYGMRTWLGLAAERGLLDGLVAALKGSTTIAARGAKALGELRKVGLDAVYTAPTGTLAELVEWAVRKDLEGKRVVLQLHGETPEAVTGALRSAGADITCVPVYRMGGGAEGAAASLVASLVAGKLDAVTFTAAPQVEALVEFASSVDLRRQVLDRFNRGGVIAACIGPVCAAAARAAGIPGPLVPEHPRLGALATAVGKALQNPPAPGG